MQRNLSLGTGEEGFGRKLARRISFLLSVAAVAAVIQFVSVVREPQDWIIVPARWMGIFAFQRLFHVVLDAGPVVWMTLWAVLGMDADGLILRLLRKRNFRSDGISYVILWALAHFGGLIVLSRYFPDCRLTTLFSRFPYSVAPSAAVAAIMFHMITALVADRRHPQSPRSLALLVAITATCWTALLITRYWFSDPLSSPKLAWMMLMILLVAGIGLAITLSRLSVERIEHGLGIFQRSCDVYLLRPILSMVLLGTVLLTAMGSGIGGGGGGVGDGRSRPNIILLTVDTVRADHLGCYGYHLSTTPNIDRFAEEATLFAKCMSTAPNTVPAIVSMMTAQYPSHHSAGTVTSGAMRLDEPTLARVLAKNGYRTAAFVSNFLLDRRLFLYGGFDIYDTTAVALESPKSSLYEYLPRRTAEKTTDHAMNWLDAGASDAFFLWVHYMDPHGPYVPPKRYAEVFPERLYGEGLQRMPVGDPENKEVIPFYQYIRGQTSPLYYKSRYDGEIAYTDECIGRLLGRVNELDLWENTIIIFTSDHGEAMGEHGVYFHHIVDVTEELIHVPLIIHFPGAGEVKRVDELMSIVDIAPTILAAAEVEESLPGSGINLMPLIRGQIGLLDREYVVAEDPNGRMAFRSRGMKYIDGPDGERLYDLNGAAGESKNVLNDEPDLAIAWRSRRDSYRDKSIQHKGSPIRYDPDDIKKLRALGYIN